MAKLKISAILDTKTDRMDIILPMGSATKDDAERMALALTRGINTQLAHVQSTKRVWPLTHGVGVIADERLRQITELGYTAEHDDEQKCNDPDHHLPELVRAAICYLARWETSPEWPWEGRGPKLTPDNRIEELAKAGALIAAEIDRLHRAEKAKEGGEA